MGEAPMPRGRRMQLTPNRQAISRRQALKTFANGFGMLGLAGLFANETFANAVARGIVPPNPAMPLGVRPAMYTPRAKRIIFLFMSGGPSHVDLFDPKPKLVD